MMPRIVHLRIAILIILMALAYAAPLRSHVSGQRVGQPTPGGLVAGPVPDPLDSYPACTGVRLVSTSGWQLVSFQQLSIRLPRRFRVPTEPFGFDHGGLMWESGDIEVSIARLYGVAVEPFNPSRTPQCRTTLAGPVALINEFADERRQGVSALFPYLGLNLYATSPRVRDLALLRTIIRSARPAPKANQ